MSYFMAMDHNIIQVKEPSKDYENILINDSLINDVTHLRSTAVFSWVILISFIGMNPVKFPLLVSTTSLMAGTLGPLEFG